MPTTEEQRRYAREYMRARRARQRALRPPPEFTPEERKERARKRACEVTKAWRKANPERIKQQIAVAQARRKEKWTDFLRQERERYRSDEEKRLAKLARQKQRREADPAVVAAVMHSHYLRNKPVYAAKVAARRAARINATPSWCDHQCIADLYREAQRLTLETGIQHEVDHVIPLTGRNVCGLHIPQNMRVVTRLENRRKFNRIADVGNAEERKDDRPGLSAA